MIVARRASVGRWIDTSTPLTPEQCAEIARLGFVGVVRTLPLPRNPTGGDLTGAELRAILDAGLECSVYQHVRGSPPTKPLWRPADHDGGADAECAVRWARACGLPEGMHLYQDLEAVDGTPDEAAVYSATWATRCASMTFAAGLYVGYAVPLAAWELYALPHTSYGSDMGNRHVAVRGTAWLQGPEATVAGVRVDLGTMRVDLLGETPFVASAGDVLDVA